MKDKLKWYLRHLEQRLAHSAVHVHLGVAAELDDILAMKPALAVVATGAGAAAPIPIDRVASSRVVDAYQALMGGVEPEDVASRHVVVYGGGETGCETAELLAARGARVTLITRSAAAQLARGAELGYRKSLRQRLTANPAVRILEKTTIVALDGRRLLLRDAQACESEITADRVFVAQGRRSENGLLGRLVQAGVPSAAIGDAHQVARIGDAVRDAYEAVRALAAKLSTHGHDHLETHFSERGT